MIGAGGPLWYDRQGRPIRNSHVAGRLLSDFDYKVVAKTEVGAYEVSTVWLGLDHGFDPEGPPVIFETMVFVAAREDDVPGRWRGREFDCVRYCTEEQAVAGHEEMVTLVRATAVDVEDWDEDGL